MEKKKPLGTGSPQHRVPASHGKRHFPLSALQAVALVLAIAVLAAFLALPKSQAGAQADSGGQRIRIYAASAAPYSEGEGLYVRVFSSCGAFSVFLDGIRIDSGDSRAELSVKARAGQHTLVASNHDCSDLLLFSVLARQCTGNQTEPCTGGLQPTSS